MSSELIALASTCTVLAGVAGFAIWKLKQETRRTVMLLAEKRNAEEHAHKITDKWSYVTEIDAEVERLNAVASDQIALTERLRSDYAVKKVHYDRLISEIAIYDDKLSFAEMGIYEPHFEFDTSDSYKEMIISVRNDQKMMVQLKRAVICTTSWHVNGSHREGEVMVNRNVRLTLRAFNNECEAIISNVTWRNAAASQQKIVMARDQINKANASNHVVIVDEYVNLKLKELRLVHERREKIKREKDEAREANRLVREEEKLLRDLERAQDEEARYQRLVDQARAEAASLTGPQLSAYAEKIALLEQQLAAAHSATARAQAMAERTKTGWVYIISNVGSFGNDVVKIGLTRRLDPEDRIRELGDASVPFLFDTHAVIYSDDAPALERSLHREFDAVRINAQNYRKEFFRATLEEVEAAIKKIVPDSDFYKEIESQEYRETMRKRCQSLVANTDMALPLAI